MPALLLKFVRGVIASDEMRSSDPHRHARKRFRNDKLIPGVQSQVQEREHRAPGNLRENDEAAFRFVERTARAVGRDGHVVAALEQPRQLAQSRAAPARTGPIPKRRRICAMSSPSRHVLVKPMPCRGRRGAKNRFQMIGTSRSRLCQNARMKGLPADCAWRSSGLCTRTRKIRLSKRNKTAPARVSQYSRRLPGREEGTVWMRQTP